MENNNQKVIKISKKKLVITLVILVVLGFVFYGVILNSLNSARRRVEVGVSMSSSEKSENYGAPVSQSMPDYYREQNDITDTREFLKTSHSSTLKTRDVPEVTKEVKSAIREVEGRIDNLTSSTNYSYVTFVVPKSRFEEFRSEVESLVYAKLYFENISSQNLLNQKQSIEERTEINSTNLVELEKRKQNLLTAHSLTISNLNKELATTQSQLTLVRQQKLLTDDSTQYNFLLGQETTLVQTELTLKQKQEAENRIYASQNQTITNQINQVNAVLANLSKEDTNFANNIETVTGTVNIQWVSVWYILKIYSPIHPLIIIILILLLARWYLVRKGYLARIEFV